MGLGAAGSETAVARPLQSGGREMVRVAEISRFLGQGADEVRILIELDGLPHARVPGKTKPSLRVALRDLHAFLLRRWQGETLMRDFEVFRGEFWRSQSSEVRGQRSADGEEEAA